MRDKKQTVGQILCGWSMIDAIWQQPGTRTMIQFNTQNLNTKFYINSCSGEA